MTTCSLAKVVTFDETRPWPSGPDGIQLAAIRTQNATFGGGGGNVAMPRARSDILAAPASALPDNDLGEAPRSL